MTVIRFLSVVGLRVLAIAFGLGAAFLVLGVKLGGFREGWLGAILLLVAAFLAGVTVKLWNLARRAAALSGTEALKKDPRAPVVYLRSFVDDPKAAQTYGTAQSSPLAQAVMGTSATAALMSSHTEEEQLAKAFNTLGPFVAVGRPGELLPLLGATRIYLSDEEWRPQVDTLMRNAALLVFRAGNTPGFWWELKHAGEILPKRKILLVLPMAPADYNTTFRPQASKALGCDLPRLDEKLKLVPQIGALLWFDAEGLPHVMPVTKDNLSDAQGIAPMNPVAEVLSTALIPVLAGKPAPVTSKRLDAGRKLNYISGAIFLILSVAVIIDDWRTPAAEKRFMEQQKQSEAGAVRSPAGSASYGRVQK